MAKKRKYNATVIVEFKKRDKEGNIHTYKVGDTYSTAHYPSLEYLRLIKKFVK